MSKSRRADSILQALLAHRTVREAAQALGLSERTVYGYLADPAFKERYRAARDDIVRGVASHLREQMSEAVDIIGGIMRDEENRPQERLAAAKAILEYGEKYIESDDLLERIRALEEEAAEA